MTIVSFSTTIISEMWHMLSDASLYILFGLLVGGILKIFLSPAYVAHHLGRGKFKSVMKAAIFGIPIPLCSCGVLPAAATLKKQGANNGATTAFLISTPESGVDSISISYALLDPIMTIARPVAAFMTALVAGFAENLINPPQSPTSPPVALNSVSDTQQAINPKVAHQSFQQKLTSGLYYAKDEIWGDMAGWFFVGLFAAACITLLVPDEQISIYLGGGVISMLLMLLCGIPLYICATASTPVAAAMILKGVSPGTALVFLLVGPATNITSLTVLIGLLGRRATVLYLSAISVVSVISGLLLDYIYLQAGISAKVELSQAAELVPIEIRTGGAVILLLLSIKPLAKGVMRVFSSRKNNHCDCGGCCR